jgi:tetratricopeptide (TPR) repeat protein
VLTAFSGYAVMSLLDYQLDVPLFAATAAALLVVLRASSSERAEPPAAPAVPSAAARLLGVLLLAALGIMLWPTLPNLRARQLFSQAADAREAGDNAAFVAGAERAARLAPWEPFYLTQLAAYYGDQYLQAGAATERTRATDQCRALLRRALEIDPDQDYCHFNLAWLLLAKEPAEAERHFRAAARLSSYRGGVYLGIGLSLLARNEDSAISMFALEWLNDPQAFTSPRWDTPPLSSFRGRVAAALHRLAAHGLKQTALSAASRDQIRYVAALTDWWLGRSADTAELVRYGSPEQRHFFQSLEAVEKRSFTPMDSSVPEPWKPLYIAWRDGTLPVSFAKDQPAAAGAFRRRLADTQNSFVRLLTGPPGPEVALIQYGRNDRPGHSVLQRNQDGFLLRDLYVYPENLLVKKYASFLFPPKGYLPDWLLRQNSD